MADQKTVPNPRRICWKCPQRSPALRNASVPLPRSRPTAARPHRRRTAPDGLVPAFGPAAARHGVAPPATARGCHGAVAVGAPCRCSAPPRPAPPPAESSGQWQGWGNHGPRRHVLRGVAAGAPSDALPYSTKRPGQALAPPSEGRTEEGWVCRQARPLQTHAHQSGH